MVGLIDSLFQATMSFIQGGAGLPYGQVSGYPLHFSGQFSLVAF